MYEKKSDVNIYFYQNISKMSEGKKNYINFTNTTPNDQNSVIPNEAMDFTRYLLNPVILRDHDWKSRATGLMRDIHFEDGNWKGLPDFHGITKESEEDKKMYDKGYLLSASIGGEMILKTTGEFEDVFNDETKKYERKPVLFVNEQGLYVAEKFYLFEVSFPTLPSNYTAVTDEAIINAQKLEAQLLTNKLGIKTFAQTEKENVLSTLTTLSLNILESNNKNLNQMTDEEKAKAVADKEAKAAEKLQAEQAAKKAADDAAALDASDKSNHVILETGKTKSLPSIIADRIKTHGILGALFGSEPLYTKPDDDDFPQTTKPKGKGDLVQQPQTIGKMSAEAAKKRAEEAVKAVKEAKSKFEEAEEGEEKVKFKKAYEEACKEAEKFCKEAEEAEAEEEASKKEAEESAKKEAEEKKRAEESAKSKENMSAQPIKATKAELAALNLAPIPEHAQKVELAASNLTFTKLRADQKEGERILGRIFNGGHKEDGQSTISDYAIVLKAMMNDKKYDAVIKQLRCIPCASMDHFRESRNYVNANPNSKLGFDVQKMYARLASGRTEGMDWTGGAQSVKTTLSTASAFSSLDTAAVEWLTLVLFKLFPSEDWKNEIPVFGAEQTGRNLGVIWTNILANAPIYRGTNPAPANNYGPYSDQSVGMTLVPYWQAPTLWQPLSMHQLRYDQMATGWLQNLAALNAQIGDDLLYTLIAGLLANQPTKIAYTGGLSNPSTGVSQTFTIPGSGSSFIFNSAFAGTLVKPGMNDIFAIEEQFMLQNYDLPRERPVLVGDSTMMRWLKSDNQTQSILTKWVNEQGAELQKISHTLIHERSRVGAYDPASATVIDTHATGVQIPATTLSAGLAFIASQVGIGLGLIDVFMIQDPTNYAYKMSVDLRINARALRSDYTGLCMYTYQTGQGQ
jgi:hypothetical protein